MRFLTSVAILLLAGTASMPAFAQRASLADRVNTLEQRAADDQWRVDLLNQVTELKGEVTALRGQVEDLQGQLAQQKDSARNQYLDVDGRLNRLEGHPAEGGGQDGTAPPARATPTAEPPAATPAATEAPAKAGGSADADYQSAMAALKAGNYVASSRGFRTFLEAHPKSPLVPNARYWLGESYYATGNYAMSADQFKTVADGHPDHPKAAGALLKLGMAQEALKQRENAQVSYGQVVSRYPGTDAARTAATRLKAMKGARTLK